MQGYTCSSTFPSIQADDLVRRRQVDKLVLVVEVVAAVVSNSLRLYSAAAVDFG